MTGDRITSADALRWGFVNHVLPGWRADAQLRSTSPGSCWQKPPMILALLKSATSALAQTMVPEQAAQSDRDLLLLTRRLREELPSSRALGTS